MTGLQADRFDISFGQFYVTAERLEVADFVTDWQGYSAVLVSESADFMPETLADICGHFIGAMAGSAQLAVLTEAAEDCEDKPTISAFPSVSTAVLALSSQRVEGVLLGSGTAADAMKNNEGLVTSGAGEFGGGPMATAVARTDHSADMLAAIQTAYDHLIQSGTYAKILEENDVTYGAIEKSVIYVEGDAPPIYRP